MATKEEWKEFFQLMNNREPNAEDFRAAVAAGEVEDDAPAVSPAVEKKDSTPKEWREYFEMLNGRQPSFDEYQKALQAGEFASLNKPTATGAIQAAVQPSVQEMPSSEVGKTAAVIESPKVSEATVFTNANAGFGGQFGAQWGNFTGTLKDGEYKDLLSPNRDLSQNSLFRLGSFGAVVSTIVSILSFILGWILVGNIVSGVGSYFANWASSNSNSAVQYNFNSSAYQSAVNGIEAFTVIFALVFLVLGIAWLWFTVYRLKSRQFRGWSIYFLVAGILGAVGVVYNLVVGLSQLSLTTQLMNTFGIKYGMYEIWQFIAWAVNALLSVIWILIFVKSRKIPSDSTRTAAQSLAPANVADELGKYKGLLDSGIITQAEFDEQKRKLLG